VVRGRSHHETHDGLLSGMALAIGVGSGAAVAADQAAPSAESMYAG
jgi:thiamine pyrophosphate-dependent acetolactate synthase large subunit-like protein